MVEGKGVRFQRPTLPDQALIDAYFEQSRQAGWYSNFGPCVRTFEERISAELLSGLPTVSAGNATVALMVAIRACFGDSRGGRVLVPSFTFIGSLSAIAWAGFEPLFIDIDEADWQTSQPSLVAALADHNDIVGALLTTTFGTPLREERRLALELLLGERGIPSVVDSAAGLGSCLPTTIPGSATVYSLHATKPFAVGEGAVIACADSELERQIRQLTNFGFDGEHAVGSTVGFNAKMPEISAATGLAVLDSFASRLTQRRALALGLVAALPELTSQRGSQRSSFQFVPMLCPDPAYRQRLLAAAQERAVQVRTYFDPPMHRLPAFAGAAAMDLKMTEEVASRIVALPMATDLSAAEVEAIISMCRSVS